MLTVSVVTTDWHVSVTSKPIYGLVPPLLNETHVHGHWEEAQRRLDIAIDGRFPQPNAHGIIGQSYQDATVRNGKHDAYGIIDTPTLADSDDLMPQMTTSAQAEGAIEGLYTDYRLASAFESDFKFSRFGRPRAHLNTKAPMMRKSSASEEWDGNKQWVGKERMGL